MPHDRDGIPINRGDYVHVVALVVDVDHHHEDLLNLCLQTVEPIAHTEKHEYFAINARQVTKATSESH